jgi:hypothetical protein
MSRQDDLMQRTAEDMAKSPREGLKVLRKYLGDEVVDNWLATWASDEDLPEDAPDVVNDVKGYEEKKKGLRKRGY